MRGEGLAAALAAQFLVPLASEELVLDAMSGAKDCSISARAVGLRS
jgi:hypothetical protein